MAKINGRWEKDNRERDCLVLRKQKGWINQKEVYEWLEQNGRKGQNFIHMADCPEIPPDDLYEEGDTWVLYEPDVILREIAALASRNTDCRYRITEE